MLCSDSEEKSQPVRSFKLPRTNPGPRLTSNAFRQRTKIRHYKRDAALEANGERVRKCFRTKGRIPNKVRPALFQQSLHVVIVVTTAHPDPRFIQKTRVAVGVADKLEGDLVSARPRKRCALQDDILAFVRQEIT